MKRLFILLLSAITIPQSAGLPTNVPIKNAAFAEPFTVVSSDQCGEAGYTAPEWNLGNGTQLLKLANPNPCGIPMPPGGTTVAIAGYGSVFSQDLEVSPASFQEFKPGYTRNGFYTLTFYAAARFGGYTGYYTTEIDYGTQELCDASIWVESVFTQVSITCPSPGGLIVDQSLPGNGAPQGGKNLSIHFSTKAGYGWPILATQFAMTFTPQ